MLLRFLREDLAEEVLGDLDEKFYATIKNRSVFRAKLNYWYQVLNYLRPFAIRKSKETSLLYYPMLQNYFKIGWRNLLKNKGYSIINIGGLAIGMAVAMLIGLWIYDELSFNKYHKNYSTIVQVYRTQTWKNQIDCNTAHVTGLGTLLRNEYGSHFENVVMVRARIEQRTIAVGEKKFTQNGYFMQPEGGGMFSLKMKHGNRDGLKDMKSILLSESLARKIFGDVDPVGQVVSMDAKWDLKVTGVYEDLPKNSEFSEASYFAPLDLFLNGWATLDAWDNYHMYIYAQLRPGADAGSVSAVIKNAMIPHIKEEKAFTKPEVFLLPMADWHLNSQFENGVQVTSERMKFVWFYGIIAAFVLILACINFMNLSTARSEKRAKEVGIRKSIGSLRSQLVQQFFGESLLVAFLALAVSLVIVQLTIGWFNTVADKNMSIPWGSPGPWLTGLGFTLFTGLLAGSYPALYLSSFNPVKVLKGSLKAGRFSKLPRQTLVIVQFTVSITLVIGTLIVYDQVQYAKDRPVGYTRQGLIELHPKSPEYSGKYHSLRNELKKTGVVEEMAEANYSITSTLGWNGGFTWQGQDIEPSFNTIFVTHEYGKTIGWEFIAGRDFSREVSTDGSGIIINESAWKQMGIPNPVGELLTWVPGGDDRGTYKILGVVKDMVKGSPFEPTDPSVIFLSEKDEGWLYIRLREDAVASEALSKIQSVFSSLIPSAPFDYTFSDEAYDAKFRSEERVGKLAAVFGFLAILISCSGLFGLASFMVEQRMKEISIRKVLGASVANIMRLMSNEFALLVLISCAVAIPLSYYFMDQWLIQYDYRTTIGWEVFMITGLSALIITLITVSFQSLKAALANPVKNIKTE
jgi:putative ABC transport system permease protein